MTTPKKRRPAGAGVPAHNTLFTCFSCEKDDDQHPRQPAKEAVDRAKEDRQARPMNTQERLAVLALELEAMEGVLEASVRFERFSSAYRLSVVRDEAAGAVFVMSMFVGPDNHIGFHFPDGTMRLNEMPLVMAIATRMQAVAEEIFMGPGFTSEVG